VQVAQRQRNLGGIKLSFRLREALHVRQVLKKFATLNEIHDEVNAKCFLKHVVHSDYERVIHLQQDEFFNFEGLN
jgi:hypothetical protein